MQHLSLFLFSFLLTSVSPWFSFLTRRNFVAALVSVSTVPKTVSADDTDFGRGRGKIFRAVTTSDLGLAVRTGVVRGAQTIDSLDGRWERFNDRYNMGTNRKRQGRFSDKREIPPRKELSVDATKMLLSISDRAFLVSLASPTVGEAELTKKVDDLDALLRRSFQISSAVDEYNFKIFIHFRAYHELLRVVSTKEKLASFRLSFDKIVGASVLEKIGAQNVEEVLNWFQANGLIALGVSSQQQEKGEEEEEEEEEEDSFTISLDGDGTQNAQILLAEQGLRVIIPDFVGLAVKALVGARSVEEYYMDTEYNSDPSLFKVRQVVLNFEK